MCSSPLARAASVPGNQAQVQVSPLRGRSQARVGDDELAAVLPLGLEILHDGRHGLGGVAAQHQDGFRAGDVFQGEGQAAVDAQARMPAAAAEDIQNRPL